MKQEIETQNQDLVGKSFNYGMLRYKITSNKTCKVISFSTPKNRSLRIDEHVKYLGVSYTVTAIGNRAFSRRYNLKKAEIPYTVESIGHLAFGNCENLETVTILSSDLEISDRAFKDCRKISSFSGKYASKDKKCLIVNGSLISFAQAGIKSYKIPDTVREIKPYAFNGSEELISITVPSTVVRICRDAFNECTHLSTVHMFEGINFIGERAFKQCSDLTSINIPPSVEKICDEAFSDCISLRKFEIYSRNFRLGKKVFANCISLEEFSGPYSSPDHRCLILNGVLKAFAPFGIRLYEIPEDIIKRIGESAFEGCRDIESIKIPQSVERIGEYAFRYCDALTKVVFPKIMPEITRTAFEQCTSYNTTKEAKQSGVVYTSEQNPNNSAQQNSMVGKIDLDAIT